MENFSNTPKNIEISTGEENAGPEVELRRAILEALTSPQEDIE